MSQVKNLRAMFESKEDTSPPDRGRSSGVSTPNQAGPHGTGSPRPLSKVRTSFVAIEKDGRMGLRRDPSGESSVSRRRLSNDTDIESISTAPDKPSMASDDATRPARKLFVSEPIPESPRQPLEVKDVFGGVPEEASNPGTLDVKQPDDRQPKLETTEGPPSIESNAPAKAIAPNGKGASEITLPERPKAPAATRKSAPRPSTLDVKPTLHKDTAKSPKTAKSPSATPKNPDPKPTTRATVKGQTKQDNAPSSKAPSKAPSSVTAKPSTAATKKPQLLKTKASHDAGFVKPKPKSPTKPVSLPSSLTAPTASSVSKGNASRQSLSRQSGTLQTSAASVRSPSRTSVLTTGAPTKTIRRQASTINRSRPSLGPPPKKVSQTEPSTKKPHSQAVDEGFLARMMRPTQSSSSKVAEKAPLTPPRKTAQRSSVSSAQSNTKHDGTVKRGDTDASPRTKRAKEGTHAELSLGPVDTVKQHQSTPEPVGGGAIGLENDKLNQADSGFTEQSKQNAETTEAPETEVVVTHTANVTTAEEVLQLAEEADQTQLLVEPAIAEPTPEASITEASTQEPLQTETTGNEATPQVEVLEPQASSISGELEQKQSDVDVPPLAAQHDGSVTEFPHAVVAELEQPTSKLTSETPSNSTL